jgi:hypothetical protein
MKRIFTIAAALLMTASVWAQAPEKMSYQAVVRDAGNALVTSTAVGMQISILQTTATGTAVYVETQTPTTNANGLVSLEIGTGTVVSGDFTTIDWATDTYFIQTETDPTGGTTYTISGTSQLMSVPYALHSKTADNIVGGITETDPTFTASEAANITATDITNLSNLSGTNTGDQTVITAAQATAITANTAKVGVTTAQATILGNTSGINTGDQTVITAAQVTAITANTTKVGVTTAQATILGNTSGINTGDQTVITVAQATAITANTAKTGITNAQATILGNTSGTNTGDQTVITAAQATAITANTTKVGVTTAQATILSNTSGTNTGDQDGSETKVTAGTNVTVTGSGTTASPYVVNATGGTSGHYVGELFGGGIVFYVYNNGANGLIASLDDLDGGSGVAWSATQSVTVPSGALNMTNGSTNTAAIVAQDAAAGYAATLCSNYSGGSFNDWYLPSNRELSLLASHDVLIDQILDNDGLSTTNGFSQEYLAPTYGRYWSSTEYTSSSAWYYFFSYGSSDYNGKFSTCRVRAVRAF